MLKKAMPAVLASALVLTACNTNNGAMPRNNETPMQDVERDKTPARNDRVGPNLDGLDDDRPGDGIIREGRELKDDVIEEGRRLKDDIIDDTERGGTINNREGAIEDNNREMIEENRDELLDNHNENRGTVTDNPRNGNMTTPSSSLRDKALDNKR